MNLLEVAVPEGGFELAKDCKGAPVGDEKVISHIRESANFDLPVFQKQKTRQGSMIYVGGGPSLVNYLDELRQRSANGDYILTSNKTHDYLVDNGIVPTACIIIDPKEIVKDYIQKPQLRTAYYVGVVCHPEVFKGLIESGAEVYKLLVAYGIEEKDIEAQKEIYEAPSCNYLVGGTMTGLRAMPFAILLGFRKIEYYGFDSCFSSEQPKIIAEGEPGYDEVLAKFDGKHYIDQETMTKYVMDEPETGFYYAYKKRRSESITIAKTPDGRKFITSPVFAHQAKQFIKWAEKLEDKLEIVIHGDSLNRHMYQIHQDRRALLADKIGDRRWTDEYMEIQKQFHSEREYGKWSSNKFEIVLRGITALYSQLDRPITILDYGCGSASLSTKIKEMVNFAEITNYDPFIDEYSKEPEGEFDVVVCLDVMEHVEWECINNTLKYITNKAKYMVIFGIATNEASKSLPDGRNAHITIRNGQWWSDKIQNYMIVAEGMQVNDLALLICQPFEAKERFENEG